MFARMKILDPTRENINNFISESFASGNITDAKYIAREIEGKSGVNASLHPSEEYFLETYLLAEQSKLK